MTDIVLPKLSQTGTNEWNDVEANDIAIRDVVNGDLDSDNLKAAAGVEGSQMAAAFLDALGFTANSTTRRDTDTVATEETTTSTTWTDLATVGPRVTVTVPSGGGLLVVAAGVAAKGTTCQVGVHVSTDRAISGTPEDGEVLIVSDGAGAYASNPLTGIMAIPVTAGSRAITLKYSVTAGTGTFKNRTLHAIVFGGF